MKILTWIKGAPVYHNPDGSVSFRADMQVDSDGSPRSYGPKGTQPLDYLANAGHPGNWWGIATDKNGNPYIQGPNDPCPGYYISTTSYLVPHYAKNDPRRYLDSEKVRFIVIPGQLVRMVAPVVMGCRATVQDIKTGKIIEAMVGDTGPRNALGEASIAVCKDFGVDANPKHGGTSDVRFNYTFYPGQISYTGLPLQPS